MAEVIERRLVAVTAAAAYAAVSRNTVYRLVHSGVVPAYRLGGSIRIDLDELDAALIPVQEPVPSAGMAEVNVMTLTRREDH